MELNLKGPVHLKGQLYPGLCFEGPVLPPGSGIGGWDWLVGRDWWLQHENPDQRRRLSLQTWIENRFILCIFPTSINLNNLLRDMKKSFSHMCVI